MAIADMFLKMQGVTGDANDVDHKGEIDILTWSWGMEASRQASMAGAAKGHVAIDELHIVKRVDQSSPTLMSYLRNNKVVPQVSLSVRKAGDTPLEYFRIELTNARVTALKTESSGDELMEHLDLGFSKVKVIYTPQGKTGGTGGGKVEFETDAHAGV